MQVIDGSSGPIHLEWMGKKVGQLAINANKPRPHPACLDGESDYPANLPSRRSKATSLGSCVILLSVLAIQPFSPSWQAGWGPGDGFAADWKPVPGHFPMSRWANDVAPDKVLPEYPRPQMVRKDWLNLNGLWGYSVLARNAKQPDSFQGEILVPFPVEAPLSGIGKMLNAFPGRTYTNSRLWYRRTFETPAAWKGRRTLLHFGAVDWEATVFLNGKQLGVHQGGYDEFSFDVTDALKSEGMNELVVAVWDPTFQGGYPRGKQIDKPAGIYYTPCTGIWQTVWLEPVVETHIKSLRIVPDIDQGVVRITVTAVAGKNDGNLQAAVEVYDGQTKIGSASGWASQELVVKIPDAKLWSPDSPFLYNLQVTSFGQRITQESDVVTSYFGMRKVSIGPDKDGITRILLNNKFVLHNGVLDQGFWPDGIYTAPTDAALRYDIETIKQLGFNMSRKHVKVEPERWYYWADKLGLLVWQDMPCSGDGIHAKPPAYAASNAQLQDQFGAELKAMIAGRFNHPSIVSWIVFNEGMGLQNSKGYKLDDNIRTFMRRMADIAAEDKTRAINAESGAPMGQYQGWNILDIGLGQIMDAHCYGTTKCLVPTKERASVIGEYGYAKFVDTIDKYMPLVKKPGVSGLVWTQITDVENERNGLLTYDRGKFNEDPEKVAAKNVSYCGGEQKDITQLQAQIDKARKEADELKRLIGMPERSTEEIMKQFDKGMKRYGSGADARAADLAAVSAKLSKISATVEGNVRTADPSSWPKADPAAIQRWQDMRFGMFIHWGPVSLKGTEIGWSRGKEVPTEVYDNLYKDFNPTKFNADEWASIAKASGMKYLVLTTKHHDGFCLWDTKFTDYNIMHTPFKRDVVKELSEACKKQGIAFGAYYSVADWYHPNWPGGRGTKKNPQPDMDAYEKYLNNQSEELITKYGPLVTIWNDLPQAYGNRAASILRRARALQPDILFNNRCGVDGDYLILEQKIGKFNNRQPWETCMTLCRQWSWKPNDGMKPLKQCLQTLLYCAGGDANLLFNVGPMPTGEIEPRQVERLKEMGAWMAKYGESIYGTRGGPFMPGNGQVSTHKDNVIYVHVLNWEKESLTLPAINRKIVKSQLLTDGNVNVKQFEKQLVISVPVTDRQEIDTIVKLELDGPAGSISPLAVGP